MTTLAAVVSPAGITAPTYAEILAGLTASYQSIYGSDAVLTPDTQDGQWLAVLAAAINDVNQAAIQVYNSYSPTYAQGAGLSSVVKINGLKREVASKSTVDVTIAGTVGTTITNGVVRDDLGNLWNLPTTVTIPGPGEITVTATAQLIGSIVVGPGAVTGINTPTAGWQSVTNIGSSVPGAPVELDGTLRQRQAVSTATPSQSIEGGILAGVRNLASVQAASIYENDSSVTDANGLPPNSIAVVVLGGDVQDIVDAIGSRKTPGTGTYGTTSGTYTDPEGFTNTINFFQMTQVHMFVDLTIRVSTLYSSTTTTYIQEALAAFISGLGNGVFSLLNRLYGPANLDGDAATDATGVPQTTLDQLAKTYQILSLSQHRGSPPTNTTVTGGPYGAGAASVDLTDTTDVYVGAVIGIAMNVGQLNTTVQSVAGSAVGFYPPVPGGNSILNGATVRLISDVQINFNEIAVCAPGDVTVTVTS